ncbi:cupin domain-containing protein [Streptomyces acidicola]|uniref:Cupin domain-containing protein n=1 Tax=Streptomyces acidicola TaxID=2596892 RepID=A0A5N8WMG6_9ACTN|nr:cupin domain-containing protein [Streptomyces acidicola]MPY47425.1 cupin domain-containing protein [Streptomyces acidicola]
MTGTQRGDEALKKYDDSIRQDNLIGQWSFEPLLDAAVGGPTPRGDAHVWPWKTTRARLAEASDVLGPAGVGRCNLTFLNPGITQGPPGSTHTLAAGIQIMRAREVCWSHRHTMSALRFVIEGNPEAFTVVDGEPLTMDRFDLLITPRFSWHDHHNPTDEEVVWLDVLDLGLTLSLNQAFYEPFGEASQPQRPCAAESQGLRAKALRPAWERPRLGRLPIRYAWADVTGILDSYGDTAGNPYDGLALRYANPVTGGPTMTTMDCWVQQFVPGFEGLRHRRTSSSVGFVISGRGRVEVGDEVLEITPGDTFAIPNYAWHRLINDSDDVLRVFSVHDIPAITAMGLFYEEPVPTVGAHPAPPVPGLPHHPVHRTDAMLEPEEVR